MNRTKKVKQTLGKALRDAGHKHLTLMDMRFCQRLQAATNRSQEAGDGGWVPAAKMDAMVERLDGEAACRDPRRRQEIMLRLANAKLVEKRRGWGRWVGLDPQLRLVQEPPKSASRRGFSEKNSPSESPASAKYPKIVSKRTIYSFSFAEAGLGEAKPCPDLKKIKKDRQTRSPRGAARRPAERNAAGRFTAKAINRECPPGQAGEAASESCASPTSPGRSTPAPRQDLNSSQARSEIPDMQTALQPLSQLCHSVGAALAWPKGKSSAKPAASRSTPDTEANREEQPVSQTSFDIASVIRDPETAKMFASMMDKDAAWKAERAAKGLPPLEPKEPAPQAVRPKLNVLGQPIQSEPVTAPPKRCYRLHDDDLYTDVTWLQLALGSCKALRGLHWAWASRQGYTRGLWRQAVGVMLSKQPGQVESPKAFLIGTLKALKDEQGPDPRTRPGFRAVEGWGPEALKFANICSDHLANPENRAQ